MPAAACLGDRREGSPHRCARASFPALSSAPSSAVPGLSVCRGSIHQQPTASCVPRPGKTGLKASSQTACRTGSPAFSRLSGVCLYRSIMSSNRQPAWLLDSRAGLTLFRQLEEVIIYRRLWLRSGQDFRELSFPA